MKRFCLGVVLVLLCSVSLHAQKTRYGQELPFPKKGVDYSLPIHVSGIRVGWDCNAGGCWPSYTLDTLITGQKLELACSGYLPNGSPNDKTPVPLGDIHGRVMPKASGHELGDGYEVLTPRGRVESCVVSGIFE